MGASSVHGSADLQQGGSALGESLRAQQAVGDQINGFTVEKVQPLPGLRAVAYQLHHASTGLRWLHLHAADRENMFALALRTPPTDDHGIAHILEHTVLCGSQRYPVKDPFVELLKSSMATFLNAMTYPDRTIYPVASQNHNDLRNLMSVYCDAVFHPLLREEHFRQEGHRLGFSETGQASSELVIKGIVYNEMKGAYSDLDGVMFRHIACDICPDNAYGHDSGGDPRAIPDLTFEEFREFHDRLYHPSNAYAFTYGDMDLRDHAAFLEQRLKGFEAIDPHSDIAPAVPWSQPRRSEHVYPIGVDEDPANKVAYSSTWLTTAVTDTATWLALKLLDVYLLGDDAAPLHKALLESGIGGALGMSGFMDHQRDTWFAISLKGCTEDRLDDFRQVVDATLAREAEGLDADRLAAAFHQFELGLGDIPSRFPLRLMGRTYQRWLYGADPFEALDLAKHLEALRQRVSDHPEALAQDLRRWLVDNPHRLDQSFVPDPQANARAVEEERERLSQMRSRMNEGELASVAEADTAIETAQNRPNDPEALATLPALTLADLPVAPVEPLVETIAVEGADRMRGDVLCGTVSHLRLALDCTGLDSALLPDLPLFTECVMGMGAGGERWDALQARQSGIMGSLNVQPDVVLADDGCGDLHLWLRISAPALHRRVPAALQLMEQRLFAVDFSDRERLAQILREIHADQRSELVGSGTQYAMGRAAAGLSTAAAWGEQLDGFAQIRHIDAMAADLDGGLDAVIERLQRIATHVRSAPRCAAVVGDDAAVEELDCWLADLPHAESMAPAHNDQHSIGDWQGVAIGADVAFVARAMPLHLEEISQQMACSVLCSQLGVGYLWDAIRVRGGAYGAMAGYDHRDHRLTLGSYRDPHIRRTLEAFSGIRDHVHNDMDLSPGGMERAIIATAKHFDRPQRPASVASQALSRHLAGSSESRRAERYAALRSLTADDIRAVADRIAAGLDAAPVCVLSSREKLEAANEDGRFTIDSL